MGFLKNIANVWRDRVAPVTLTVGGALLGGPAGALAGQSVAQGVNTGRDAKNLRDQEAAAEAAANEREYSRQKEFAQNSIQWRVNDAKSAGLHPAYALGAAGSSYSPQSYSSGNSSPSDYDLAGQMGQNISRAISVTRTGEEREMQALNLSIAKAELGSRELDNLLKAEQLRQLQLPSPAAPGSSNFIPGQGNSGLINTKPLERTATAPGRPWSEPGAVPEVGWAMTSTGGLAPVPSMDVKNRIEDNMIQESMHAWRNNILPNVGAGPRPPDSALPRGAKKWSWSHVDQAYLPDYGPSFKQRMRLQRFREAHKK